MLAILNLIWNQGEYYENYGKSILEAGGLSGRVYETHTHSITPKEHQFFLELQRSWRKQEEKEQNKK